MARDVELDIVANDKTALATRSAARNFDRLGRKVNSVSKDLDRSMPDTILEKISKSVESAFRSLPSEVQGVAILAASAIGLVFSAALAAAITSGVLLAIGGGVLTAGVALAFKDPKIQEILNGKSETFTHGLQKKPKKGQAFEPHGSEQTIKTSEGLIDKVQRVFGQAATPFVQPLADGLDGISKLLDKLSPQIDKLFATMAPALKPLLEAFGTILEKALPGIQHAAEASLPLFEKLAEHAPKIGEAIGIFFDKIAAHGPEAAQFFGDLLTFIEATIVAFGIVISGLTALYGTIRSGAIATRDAIVSAIAWLVDKVLGFFGTLINGAAAAFGWVPGIGPKLKEAADKFNTFRNDVNNALNGIKDKTVWVNVKVGGLSGLGDTIARAIGADFVSHGLSARAHGGPVFAGRPYVVGEKGPEIVRFGQSGNVSSNADSAEMMSGSSPGPIELHLHLTGTARDLIRVIGAEVRGSYAGNVQVALGGHR